MKVLIEGYVITARKGEGDKKGAFEFLIIGDGNYQRSNIMRIAGDVPKVSLTDKVRIEIIEQSYADKKTGDIKSFWRKTETPIQPVQVAK